MGTERRVLPERGQSRRHILLILLTSHGHTLFDMWYTCNYARYMSKMIQIRNVPDALHRGLKARAALSGMALSDYLLREIKEIAERPTLAELREQLHRRKPVSIQIDTARLVREERDDPREVR